MHIFAIIIWWEICALKYFRIVMIFFVWYFPTLRLLLHVLELSGRNGHWYRYSDESVWRLHFYSLFGQPGFCLIFILSKNKVFQSGALLKMPPSSRNLVSNKSTLKKCSFQLWKQEFWSNKNHPDKYVQHQVLPCA